MTTLTVSTTRELNSFRPISTRIRDLRQSCRTATGSATALPQRGGALPPSRPDRPAGLGRNRSTTAPLPAVTLARFSNFFADKRFVWRVTSCKSLRSQLLVFRRTVMPGVSPVTLRAQVVEHATARQTRLVRPAAGLRQLLKLAGNPPEQPTQSFARWRCRSCGRRGPGSGRSNTSTRHTTKLELP
jgi:hypothetical protein